MKVDWQFKDLVVVDCRDSVSGTEAAETYDSVEDSADIEHLVTKIVQAAWSQTMLAKSGAPIVDESWNDWDEPLTARPLEKRFTNPLNFAKWTMGYKWGITRIEEKTIDGDRWTYAYAGDELVDARVIGSLF